MQRLSNQQKNVMHCDEMHKTHTRGRPKFGFGFGAESWQMSSFGKVSVSAEAKKLDFGLFSVSAETNIDFRSSAEDLF